MLDNESVHNYFGLRFFIYDRYTDMFFAGIHGKHKKWMPFEAGAFAFPSQDAALETRSGLLKDHASLLIVSQRYRKDVNND